MADSPVPVLLARCVGVHATANRLVLILEYPAGSGTVWKSLSAATLQMQYDAQFIAGTATATLNRHHVIRGSEWSAPMTTFRPLRMDDLYYHRSCVPIQVPRAVAPGVSHGGDAIDVEWVQCMSSLSNMSMWTPLSALITRQVRESRVMIEANNDLLPPMCPHHVRVSLPTTHVVRQQVCSAVQSLTSGRLIFGESLLSMVAYEEKNNDDYKFGASLGMFWCVWVLVHATVDDDLIVFIYLALTFRNVFDV